MKQIINESPIIRISKHIVVEQIMNKVTEVQNTPEYYKKDNIIPIRWHCEKAIDKETAKENGYFVVETDRNHGLTLSKYNDGSGRVAVKDIDKKVVKTILKEGFNLETLRTFDKKLSLWIEEVNENIRKEEELCREFLEEEVVMEEIDDEDFDELEELEV